MKMQKIKYTEVGNIIEGSRTSVDIGLDKNSFIIKLDDDWVNSRYTRYTIIDKDTMKTVQDDDYPNVDFSMIVEHAKKAYKEKVKTNKLMSEMTSIIAAAGVCALSGGFIWGFVESFVFVGLFLLLACLIAITSTIL